eukprot:CAMPEP_0114249184 /NCGR_PEP_ID=MMETSP0058-20121206/13998_1 /TAXON_ID=36894 /ORGANISM="Pyramimonas parkeae, CCMP726" /LENGTH=252 /DNA_ID=CAMNT_0001362695 /DNA_START=464 /DNA_END=1219 /DNA_ORIENTATION=+
MSTPKKQPQDFSFEVLHITVYGFLFQGVKGTRRAQLALGCMLVALPHSMAGDVRPLILVVVLNPMLFLIPAALSYLKTNNLEDLGMDGEPNLSQPAIKPDDAEQEAPEVAHRDLLWHHHSLHNQQIAIENQARASAVGHSNLSNQATLVNQQLARSCSEIEQALDVPMKTRDFRAPNELTKRSHSRVVNDHPGIAVIRSHTLNPTWTSEFRDQVKYDDTGRSLSTPARAREELPAEPSGVLINAANHMQTEW